MYISQWERLVKNQGVWMGSFTLYSPKGEQLKNTPSELRLESLNENKTLKLTLTRENKQPIVSEFTHLNRNIFLFEEGHFAKGSQQFSLYAIFAAEYGFIIQDRRCRLVQLFDDRGNLETVTLIREFRQNSDAIERPPLSIEQLEGEWRGEARTLYPDWRNTDPYETTLTIEKQGNTLSQTLITPQTKMTTQGQIDGNTITFSQGELDVRVLLLPDGASSVTPLTIKPQNSFLVEFGWLVEPNKRLRIIRQYDEQGKWVNVTLITEVKQS